MKKILIGLLFTFFMVTNVNAAVEVKLKNDEFVPGKTIEVDIDTMKDMDSSIYNAWLEKDIEYKWYLDGTIIEGQTKNKLTIKEDYQGKEIHVKVLFFDEEVEGGPYKIEEPILDESVSNEEPPMIDETPVTDENQENIETTGTQTDDKGQDILPKEKNQNIVIYVISALLIIASFICGMMFGRKGKENDERE